MKFRKKPVVIDAVQLTIENLDAVSEFIDGKEAIIVGSTLKICVYIQTLEGRMTAEMGDWIIKGAKGELYPCKPDIFDATYEPVEQSK